MVNPRKDHWRMVKHIPRYLKGTSSVGLVYKDDTGSDG